MCSQANQRITDKRGMGCSRGKSSRAANRGVAESRRAMPRGGTVPEDYVFHGPAAGRRPHEREAVRAVPAGKRHPPDLQLHVPARSRRTSAGPATARRRSCRCRRARRLTTAPLDQLDGAAEHAPQHINFAVVAKTSPPRPPSSPRSAGGDVPALVSAATHTTVTTTEKSPRASDRPTPPCSSATGHNPLLPGLQLLKRRRTAIRTLAMSARWSHSGNLFDLTPDGRPESPVLKQLAQRSPTNRCRRRSPPAQTSRCSTRATRRLHLQAVERP